MSLHRNTMSPALLAVVLLSACGGGGNADGGGTAVSSSPNAPSVTTSQNAVANTTTETVTGQTTTAEAGNATTGSKAPSTTPTTPAGPSTPPATSAETATQTVGEKPPTSSANIASTVGAGSEATGNGTANTSGPQPTTQTEATRPEFFVPKKYLRGDVLLTMLDAKTPVTGRGVHREVLQHISPIFLETGLARVSERGGELVYRDPEHDPHPAIFAESSVTPDTYTHIDDEHIVYSVGRYHPVTGIFTLQVNSEATNYQSLSSGAFQPFSNLRMTLIGNAGEKLIDLGKEMIIETLNGTERLHGYSQPPYPTTYTLKSDKQLTFSRDRVFYAWHTIQSWTDPEDRNNYALFSWQPGPGPRDADLCWHIHTRLLKRTQCSTWTIQEDWTYGERFMGGGIYIEDDRSVHEGENGTVRWRIDGESSSISIG